MEAPGGSLKTAEEVLQSLLQNGKSPLAEQFLRWRVWKDWEKVVGPSLSRNSQPVSYQKGTLYVWVKSASWMNEMSYHSKTLKNRINEHVKKKWVRDIRFTMDRRSVPKIEETPEDLKEFLSKQLPSGDEVP